MLVFILSRWKESLRMPRFRRQFAFGVLLLIFVGTAFSFFLDFIQQRTGYIINDPVIARIGPFHLCSPIQIATYLPVFAGLIYLSVYPSLMNRFVFSFTALLFLRAVTMFLVPLEPPSGFIELRDVVLEATAYRGQVITKDLFFSGHVATLFLFSMLVHHRLAKIVFMSVTAGVGTLLVLQHVHYSIDVLAAPFFSFAALRFTERML
ncbi:MAG: hypothetical protein IT233_13340 [Bacteroidia bacterium]|nr:hypothetical protein [Bacteroidia bacterium]